MKGQLPSYRQRQASRLHSVSGSRVHGWHPPQQEQQLAPPQAVAVPEVLPATELEPEQQQQQQDAAVPLVPQDNTYVWRSSQERVRMARDLGLDRTAAPSSNIGSSAWLELAETAAAAAAPAEPAAADAKDAAGTPGASAADSTTATGRPVAPKGWSAAAAAAAAASEDVVASSTAVDAANGTTTYTFSTGSSSSSITRDSRPRIFDSAVGTAVDREAAAASTLAAANVAAASAAAANVASVSSWLYDQQEQQPLAAPQVQVVRMELARSPDGAEPAHFYMPDPLCIPAMCVEAGQQREALHAAYNRQLVAACWRQAGRVAAIDKDPEAEGFVLLDYEEQEHQLQLQAAADAAAAAAAADQTAAAEPEAAVVLASGSSSSSSNDGEAEAAAAEAVQPPDAQLPQQQQEVQPEMATVEFCYRCVTQPGERLWLVGSSEALGDWDAAKAAKMKWGEGHTWSVSLPFPVGTTVTYKAVLQLADKEPKYWRWQAGPNCAVEARGSSSSSDGKPLKVKHDFK
uniref:CBM20 domain-containing protein n=1 Tax=Tetradesmus obliquus TaxID=3088 RepID=A0A383WFW8_TETOB|eukprot:jgi/Sobl393_1/5337/SZX75646.1